MESIKCSLFVYKHIFCTQGELFIGNGKYEIIYDPKEINSINKHNNKNNDKNSTTSPKTNTDSHPNANNTDKSNCAVCASHSNNSPNANNTDLNNNNDHITSTTDPPSIPSPQNVFNESTALTPEPSPFIFAPIDPITSMSSLLNINAKDSNSNDIIRHKIVIKWKTISGLQRINKDIQYNSKDKHSNSIQLREQLIIESLKYPQKYVLRYNSEQQTWEQSAAFIELNTHYIGIEYDLIDSHNVLLGNNYENNGCVLDDYDDTDQYLSLLDLYPSKSVLLNESLPAWIWIPLLNHKLRIFFQRIILFGNIGIFIWTIYQMTKYTSIISNVYEWIFRPLFKYISQPTLKFMYYIINLSKFNVVIQFISHLFRLFYDFLPISLMYQMCTWFDIHIIQSVINSFKIFYNLCTNIFNLFNYIFRIISYCFHLILSCFKCTNCWTHLIPKCISFEFSKICRLFDLKCCKLLSIIWRLIRKCCRLCRRGQTLTNSSSTLLRVGNNIEVENVGGICVFIKSIYLYFRKIIDIFWLGIGKPIKHCYDFLKYIRSEVGTIIAAYICKCCKKSKKKIHRVGSSIVLNAIKKSKKQPKINYNINNDKYELRKRKNNNYI